MVFERIVTDIINKYLGAFVEDLDKSQLSIGIFTSKQGVTLKKLNLKENALETLNIPFKIKTGYLGKVNLKIPWKNLYTEPMIIHIEEIVALVVPNISIKYDEELDRRSRLKEKQNRLAQIEFIKNWERNKDKATDQKKDTFIEKLATQIIKNVQIKITSIHIRYEDYVSNPKSPFAVGVTLHELAFLTTDATWKETVIKEAVSQIYKLIRLDSLSVYWNLKNLMQDKTKKQIQTYLLESIPKQGSKSKLQFIIQPISAVAHLRQNTKPELMNLSLPKLQVTIVVDEINVILSKNQYDAILEMAEGLERMQRQHKYKKTRPLVPYKGNAKKWWQHAYAVVLVYTVQRRRNMWKWPVMKRHRENMKTYKELYINKLNGRKLSRKEQDTLDRIEEELDVLNISIARNQAELEVARNDRWGQEKNVAYLWVSSWFVDPSNVAQSSDPSNPQNKSEINQLSDAFTDAEKAKLYKAIGYDDNVTDPTYPLEFISMRIVVKLNKLSAVMFANKKKEKDSHLLKLLLTELCASVGQRPAANSIRVDIKMDQLRVVGRPRSDYTPKLISSVGVSKEANISLLVVTIETNPLTGDCDTKVRAQSRPLEMIYDAVTINTLVDFFKPPESVTLTQLADAAMARYDQIISQTTAGVVYLMSGRKYKDVEVHLMPSYVIIPETGELRKDSRMLLMNLGSLDIVSERREEMPKAAQLSQKEIASHAYDKFKISLENMQLLFVQPGDTWKSEAQSAHSPLYILRPMSMQVLLEKCIFNNDPNLPLFQVSGELPLVAVTLSDSKLLAIINLIQSIPLPVTSETIKDDYEHDDLFDVNKITPFDLTRLSRVRSRNICPELINLTQLSMFFIVKEVSLEIRETIDQFENPFLQLTLNRIGAKIKARTYDLSVAVYLGAVYLKHLQYKISENMYYQLEKCHVVRGGQVFILNTPILDENEQLLTVRYIQANRKGPEFKTAYSGIPQSITVEFSSMDVVLHQGVLLSLIEFSNKFQSLTKTDEFIRLEPGRSSFDMTRKSMMLVEKSTASRSDSFSLKLKGIVDHIQFGVLNARCVIMHSKIEGIELGLAMQQNTVGVNTLMRKIEVIDAEPKTYHPQIFTVHGSEILKMEMVIFNNEAKKKPLDDPDRVDLSLALHLGRANIVFVNKFIMSLVHFFDNFAVAKAKLIEAKTVIKEVSKDVTRKLHEKSPRVKLDITIKAPLITVPQNSRSQNVLNVHLGDVIIHNSFELGTSTWIRKDPQVRIVENMKIKLSNLWISRGITQRESTNLVGEVTVLDPLSFLVDVKRNISRKNVQGISDIEVQAGLEKIEVKLNQEDVRLMMQIATENIDERYADGPTSSKARLVIVHEKPVEQRTSNTSILKLPVTTEEVHSSFKMEFKLMYVNIELYRGLVNLLQAQEGKVPDRLLTYMTLKTLRVNLEVMSDTSVSATVYLHDISMDDCRSEKVGGITKLIRRTKFKKFSRMALKAREKEEKDNMAVHVTFEKNDQKDKKLEVHICSLHICICLEFLMKVAEFFTKAKPDRDPDEKKKFTREVKAVLEHKDAMAQLNDTPEMEGSIYLKLELEKPEIFIIENQMNPHTDGFIVNVEMSLYVTMSARFLEVSGGLRQFGIISCNFEKEDSKSSYFRFFKWDQDKTRRISTIEKDLLEICYNYYEQKWEMLPILSYVLIPTDIRIAGSGPQSKDHRIDLTVNDFILNVSPHTVRLLTAITASTKGEEAEQAVISKQKDYTHLWEKQALKDCDYWFIQEGLEEAVGDPLEKRSSIGALERSPSMGDLQTITILYVKEKFLQRKLRYYRNRLVEMLPRFFNLWVKVPVFMLKLEGGMGSQTIPLFIIQCSLESQMHNWTSDIYMKSTMTVELAYNNEITGVWEPILEPVADYKSSSFKRWYFTVELEKAKDMEPAAESLLPPPKLTVNIIATEPLQLVLTKTVLDLLNQLTETYSEAHQLRQVEEESLLKRVSHYQFKNMLGQDMMLSTSTLQQVDSDGEFVQDHLLCSGADIFMNECVKEFTFIHESIILSTKSAENFVIFQLSNSPVKCTVCIKDARAKIFKVEDHEIVVSTKAFIGQKVISFTSTLQVTNHLNVPINLQYSRDAWLKSAGIVYPHKTLPVSLEASSSLIDNVFFLPETEDKRFLKSSTGINWRSLTEKTEYQRIVCETKTGKQPFYYFNVLTEFSKTYIENSKDWSKQMVTVHLQPSVILHNLLPVCIEVSLKGTEEYHVLAEGHNIPLSHASINSSILVFKIIEYRQKKWTAIAPLQENMPEETTIIFQSQDAETLDYMDLGLGSKMNDGSLDVTVFCPYWIVNLTELNLTIQESGNSTTFAMSKEENDIMLFFFRDEEAHRALLKGLLHSPGKLQGKCCSCCKACFSKKFKARKKVSIKVENGQWSDLFSLDTAGSGGRVFCKRTNKKASFEVGVRITLCSSGLTKIVTFTPFYLFMNEAFVPLSVKEVKSSTWLTIKPGECRGFYPESLAKVRKLVARVEDLSHEEVHYTEITGSYTDETVPFAMNRTHTSLMKLENKVGGVNADCQISDSSVVTVFKTYSPGMAAALVVNHTVDMTISFKQLGTNMDPIVLEPQTSVMYTWFDPQAKRMISWSCGEKKNFKTAINKDKIERHVLRRKNVLFFVSFLDGLQRVIMFTQDSTTATLTLETGELEQADSDLFIKICDVGFTLINNENLTDVIYLAITNSGVIWEEQKKKKFKALKIKDSEALESAYQSNKFELKKVSDAVIVRLDGNRLADLNNMMFVKPRICPIRRSYEPGVWIELRSSPHSFQCHAKLNNIQLDSQLRNCKFPVVLATVPPPKSVTNDGVPPPFLELSVITTTHKHNNLVQMKYCKLLMQEIELKIDLPLIYELIHFFSKDVQSIREKELTLFKGDIARAKKDLKEETGLTMQARHIIFVDHMHISPIKIRFSFSLGGASKNAAHMSGMGIFLQSVGLALTNVNDVVFKLGYFEKNHSFCNSTKLTKELIIHYGGQGIKQMYVLVLGLDVLGNPYGLLKGLTEGIEDLFYEPYQGAIQGPQEFAEGLSLGFRSLLGHAVGGTASAVSRITGTLGKGLAVLTLDAEYLRKQRERNVRQNITAKSHFVRGGSQLVMGFYEGVTGIVTQPIKGLRKRGIAGLVLGIGKGIIGVVIKPAVGIMNFASISFEGVRRLTERRYEPQRLRPRRMIRNDGIVHPYILEVAEGYNYLGLTDEGKYLETDQYISHLKIKDSNKNVFLVTDKRVLGIRQGNVMGTWKTEWTYTYDELDQFPKAQPNGILIYPKEKEGLQMLKGDHPSREILSNASNMNQELVNKITELMKASRLSSQFPKDQCNEKANVCCIFSSGEYVCCYAL